MPVLQERAAQCEAMRRCPDETIRDYLANDLLRICQPARYGGFEHNYDVLCEVSQTLARGCGSQAWVHMVLTDNILKLASYSAQAQEDVWGKDPTAKLSNCVTPTGKGRPVDGGVDLERTASVLQRRRPRRLGAGGRRRSTTATASRRARCWCRRATSPSSTTGT